MRPPTTLENLNNATNAGSRVSIGSCVDRSSDPRSQMLYAVSDAEILTDWMHWCWRPRSGPSNTQFISIWFHIAPIRAWQFMWLQWDLTGWRVVPLSSALWPRATGTRWETPRTSRTPRPLELGQWHQLKFLRPKRMNRQLSIGIMSGSKETCHCAIEPREVPVKPKPSQGHTMWSFFCQNKPALMWQLGSSVWLEGPAGETGGDAETFSQSRGLLEKWVSRPKAS